MRFTQLWAIWLPLLVAAVLVFKENKDFFFFLWIYLAIHIEILIQCHYTEYFLKVFSDNTNLIWIFSTEVATVCSKVWQWLFSFTNTEIQIVKKLYQAQKYNCCRHYSVCWHYFLIDYEIRGPRNQVTTITNFSPTR